MTSTVLKGKERSLATLHTRALCPEATKDPFITLVPLLPDMTLIILVTLCLQV